MEEIKNLKILIINLQQENGNYKSDLDNFKEKLKLMEKKCSLNSDKFYDSLNMNDSYFGKHGNFLEEKVKNLEEEIFNKEEKFKNKIKEINKLQIANMLKEV